ncbi:hypothetical protein GCWU000324_00338 [Kingella oralis ATCC 51147]|uniref:Uncharacterized protein n=1 Tax=Kingella oralis ATCC 51147 TaxID=629741 RepID=C4GHK4_9NEIS|nr:hypothetical protein GCWU000324_00338 [Kingella oralis ATCC 51147]
MHCAVHRLKGSLKTGKFRFQAAFKRVGWATCLSTILLPALPPAPFRQPETPRSPLRINKCKSPCDHHPPAFMMRPFLTAPKGKP